MYICVQVIHNTIEKVYKETIVEAKLKYKTNHILQLKFEI